MSKNTKIILIVSSALVIAGVSFVIVRSMRRKRELARQQAEFEAQRLAQQNESPLSQLTSGVKENIPGGKPQVTLNEGMFSNTEKPHVLAQKNLGANAKLNTSNNTTEVSIPSKRMRGIFYSNNRYALFRDGENTFAQKGTYREGGKILVPDGQSKTFNNNSVWNNLYSVIALIK